MLLSIRTFANRVLAGAVAASLVALAVTAGFTPLGSEPAQAVTVGQTSLAPDAPAAVPAAPVVVDVQGEGLGLSVAWLPDDPADAVTSFTITAAPVAGTETSTCPSPDVVSVDEEWPATGFTVPGLCAQVAYTATVVAHNLVGHSALSNVSDPAAALVAQSPSVPLVTGTLGRDGTGLVGWSAPTYDGGDAVTSYAITLSNPDGVVVSEATADTSTESLTFTGLTNDVEYQVSLTAVNSVGHSSASTAAVTPRSAYVPTAPIGLNAVPDASDAIDISWSAPVDDGGAAVALYRVTYRRAELAGDTWEPVAGAPIHSLTADAATFSVTATEFEDTMASYIFTVEALNAVGVGEPVVTQSGVSPNVVIRDTTVVLDELTASAVDSVTDTTLVWNSAVPTRIVSVVVGDVLVSGVSAPFPSGLLREVTATRTASDGTVTLTTIDASIDDIFVSMSMSTSSDLGAPAEPAGAHEASNFTPKFVPATSGVRALRTAVGGGQSLHKKFIIPVGKGVGSFGYGDTARLSVTGQISIDVNLSASLYMDGILHPSLATSATATAEVGTSFDVGINIKKDIVLGEIPGPTATFSVGPVPVVIQMKIVPILQVGGKLEFSVSASKKVGGAVSWNSKHPDALELTDLGGPFTYSGGNLDGGSSYSGSAYIAVKFEIIAAFYAVAGPSISATMKWTATIRANPQPGERFFTLQATLDMRAGVAMEIFGFHAAADASFALVLFEPFFGSATPPVTYVVSPEVSTVAAGSTHPFIATRSDGVYKDIEWTIDRGLRGDTIADGVFTAAEPEGRYLFISAMDDTGASGSARVYIGRPFSAPGPLAITATNEPFSLTVSWAAPSQTGGAPVVDYLVTTTSRTGERVDSVTGTSITFDDIEPGNVDVEVRARNAAGRISDPATETYYSSACQARVDAGGTVFVSDGARACSPSWASGTMSTTVDGLLFTVDIANLAAGATVVDYDRVSQGTDVSIPAQVEIGGSDYAVTTIGRSAFDHDQLTSVSIPNSVTIIGVGAFQFNQLHSVLIPDSVTTIEQAAFAINSLESIEIPDSVNTLGDAAFSNNLLTSVVIPSSITAIGWAAFAHNNLVRVHIPDTVTTIDGDAFEYNLLRWVDLPDRVTYIGHYAFGHNPLASVTIPASVTFIGEFAFSADYVIQLRYGTSVLKSVTFMGDAPASIYQRAFGSVVSPGGPIINYFGDHASSGFTSPTWTPATTGFTPAVYRSQEVTPALVTFDANGHGSAPAPQVGFVGIAISDPGTLSSNGFTFGGWYDAASGGTRWDFNTPLESDLTLYAHWTAGPMTYTVTFETGNGGGATTANVVGDATATRPADPVRANYDFAGWFDAASGSTAFDFRLPITSDVTLYAQWTPHHFKVDGLTYTANGALPSDGATITGYNAAGQSGDVTIPASVTLDGTAYAVTAIGDYVFFHKDLTAVALPDSLTTIGEWAFRGNELTAVTIPDSVTTIGGWAFTENKLESLVIPDSVTTLGEYAFARNQLATISIPATDMTIGDGQFSDNLLTSVTIPDTVSVIGDQWFARNRLTSLTIPDSVTTIAGGAFGGNQLTSVTFPASVTTIGEWAFAENLLTSVDIPDTVTSLGSAFPSNRLTSFTLPAGITAIPDNTFSDNRLTTVSIPESVTSIGEGAFEQNLLTSVTVPDSVTAIGGWAFTDNLLRSVTIADSVTSIGECAFCGNRLTSVTIPDSVTDVGGSAFSENPSLVSVVFRGDTPATVGDEPFGTEGDPGGPLVAYYVSHGSSGFTPGTWSVGGVSYRSHGLVCVTFDTNGHGGAPIPVDVVVGDLATDPGAVAAIGYSFNGWFDSASGGSAFDFASPVSGDVVAFAQWTRLPGAGETTIDGITYVADSANATAGATATDYDGVAQGADVVIPGSVNIAGINYAVTALDDHAFYDDRLASVSIPESVTVIGAAAFGKNLLTSVTIPSSVTTLAAGVFANNKLTSVTIPDSVTTIGDKAFEGNLLAGVALPASVTTVGNGAFSSNQLTSVAIGDSVAAIGDFAFANNVLGSVIIPDSVTALGHAAFANNKLTSVVIGSSVQSFGDVAFANNMLASVVIPGSVTAIGDHGFSNNLLASISIPASVTTIGKAAFSENRLASVTIGDSVTTIGESAFYDNLLTSVTMPNSVTAIGKYAFASNELASVVIPESVATIGEGAFSNNLLTSVTIPGSVTTIGDDTFSSNQLTSVVIPDSVTAIGNYAFAYNDLRSVTIPAAVTTVGDYAFSGGENLADVTFAGNAPTTFGTQPFGYAHATYGPVVSYYLSRAGSGFTAGTWTAGDVTYRSRALGLVAFDANGHGTPPAAVSVVVGQPVADPGEILAPGYTFDGWFTAPSGGSPINFATPVTADLTIYAHWAAAEVFSVTPVPTITGSTALGDVLTANTGTWSPTPTLFTYSWLRDGVLIPGETLSTYTLGEADLGASIAASVNANKANYPSVTRVSVGTAVPYGYSVSPVPTITGSTAMGSVLTASTGTWAPVPTSFTYVWLRNGVAISGATQKTYTLVEADLGKSITVSATAVKTSYPATSKVSAGKAVPFGYSVSPVPTITGSTVMGSVLTANTGPWAPVPTSFTYKWLRGGVAISGATQKTYTLVEADLGKSITVSATAVKTSYPATSKASVATAVPYGYSVAPVPTITGSTVMGSVLTANAGTWAPVPTSFTYKWLRGGVAIAGATQKTYTLVEADLGKTLTVSVTAVKTSYPATSKVSAGKVVPYGYSVSPAPTITGSTVMGSVLTANAGTWAPVPTSFTYKWLRGGVAISGATQKTYTLVQADLGKTLTVSVTAVKTSYPATSKVSVGKAVPYGYSVSPVPTITGSTVRGSVLTANTGTWAPVPTSFTYKWLRGGVAISGATQKTYTLVQADLGKTLTVSVTAVKTSYPATSKVSAGKAVPYAYTVAPVPTITGSPKLGSILTANAGTWAPVPTSFTYVWRRNGVAISGATQKTYKLVQADRGKTLTVSVTAVKTNFQATSKVSAGKVVP